MKVHNGQLPVCFVFNQCRGYGWILDTKFQKFSGKGWIWIFKKLIGYGSGVEKSISARLWFALRCGKTHRNQPVHNKQALKIIASKMSNLRLSN